MATENPNDIDHGLEALIPQMEQWERSVILIGIQGSSALESPGDSDATIVDIATFMEFGTVRIVARPFMKTTLDQNESAIIAFVESQYGRMLDGNVKATEALNQIGLFVVSKMQATIRSSPSWAAANEPSTLIAKAPKTKPLVNEGQLVASITHVVQEL